MQGAAALENNKKGQAFAMPKSPAKYRVSDLLVDVGQRRVTRNGDEVELGGLTFDLLVTLIERAPDLVTHSELAEKVWAGRVVHPATVGQRIKMLRSALGDDAQHPRYVRVLRGQGYQLIPQVETLAAELVVPGTASARPARRQAITRPADAQIRSERNWLVQAGSVVLALLMLAAGATAVTFLLEFPETARVTESRRPDGSQSDITRFSIPVPAAIRRWLDGAPQKVLALSPDGRKIVFSAGDLTVRTLDRLDLRALPGTDDAHQPFFSPDGEWVAYFTPGALKKVRADGDSRPTTLVELSNGRWHFGVWRNDDTIVYSTGDSSLSIVSANGGEPTKIELGGESGQRIGGPMAIHEATGNLLLTFGRGPTDTRIEIYDWNTSARSAILEDAWLAALTSGDHVLFVRGGLLMAASVDFDSLNVGTVVNVPIDIEGDAVGVIQQFSVSGNDTLAYLAGNGPGSQAGELGWLTADGEFTALMALPPLGAPRTLDFSPDFRSVLTTGARNMEVITHLIDVEGPLLHRPDVRTQSATWHTDGRRVALGGREGLRIWDSASDTQMLIDTDIRDAHGVRLTPDGAEAVYMANRPDKNIYRFDIAQRKEYLLLGSSANEFLPAISPDGSLLAYVSDASGEGIVHVARLHDIEDRVSVNARSYAPVWSADGAELFFVVSEDSKQQMELRGIRVTAEGPLSLHESRTVLTVPYAGTPDGYRIVWGNSESPMFDVAAGHDRFLVMRVPIAHADTDAEIIVVHNFVRELETLVPSL